MSDDVGTGLVDPADRPAPAPAALHFAEARRRTDRSVLDVVETETAGE